MAEQSKLEAGLRSVGRELPAKERWQAIAKLVGTRSASECVRRYKALAAAVKGARK